jgi:hypothetical protein
MVGGARHVFFFAVLHWQPCGTRARKRRGVLPQARNLVWRDLSAEQLASIRSPHPKKGLTARDLLARFLGISDPSSPKNAISLDLYVHTLQFGQVRFSDLCAREHAPPLGVAYRAGGCRSTHSLAAPRLQELRMADGKLSGLLAIVRETHRRSMEEKLTLERSFAAFKELVLQHSVQRPPYSVGLLAVGEMKLVLEWFVDSYYRHYKLYMHAFTDRCARTGASAYAGRREGAGWRGPHPPPAPPPNVRGTHGGGACSTHPVPARLPPRPPAAWSWTRLKP